MKTIITEDGAGLNVLTTEAEIKSAASKNSRASLYVELNEEVVAWLLSINSDNRPISTKDVRYWANMINAGDWDFDSCVMNANQSGTRLIDGQHRLLAVKSTGDYALIANLKITPDRKTEVVFDNQDCNGKKRRVSEVLGLKGVVSPRWKQSLDNTWRELIEGDATAATAHTVERFLARFQDGYDDFISSQRKFGGLTTKVPAVVYVALLAILEKRPEKKGEMLDFFEKFVLGTFSDPHHPLYCLRTMFTNKEKLVKRTRKDLLWLTIKAFLFAAQGRLIGSLSAGSAEIRFMAKEFGISSQATKKIRNLTVKKQIDDFTKGLNN